MAFFVAAVAIPCYFLLGALFVERVPTDIGALATVLLVVLLALYVSRRHKPFNIVERACAYVAAICVVYLVQVMPGALDAFSIYRNILFAAMTVSIVIMFRFSKDRFSVTPMDFLVILVALVVPNLPAVNAEMENAGVAVAKLIVLLYSIELVLNNIWRRWDMMRLTTYMTFAVLGVRGVTGATP
jgi:UDP-GlcNAc:undecaprenyl-phosphate GlcNAc-1-phosphate transferase